MFNMYSSSSILYDIVLYAQEIKKLSNENLVSLSLEDFIRIATIFISYKLTK